MGIDWMFLSSFSFFIQKLKLFGLTYLSLYTDKSAFETN